MIEQQSQAVSFIVFYTASKQGVTGLTVTADVYELANSTKIVSAAAATELGDGLYFYTLAGTATATKSAYLAVFKTSGAVDQQHIPAAWFVGVAGVEELDAAVSSRNATTPPAASAIASAVWDTAIAGHETAGSTGQALAAAGGAGDPLTNQVPGAYASGTAGHALGRISSGQITTVSPIGSSGNVSVLRGDDYFAADGRAIDWTDTDGLWPDLTSATVTLGVTEFSKVFALAIITASGADKKVRLELSKTDSAAMPRGPHSYSIKAALSDGNVATIVSGLWQTN